MKNNIEKYLDHLKHRNLSAKTIRIRRYALREFHKIYKDKRVQDITEKDIINYANQISDLRESTQYIRMCGLKLFFKWLEKSFIIFSDPMADITMKKPPKYIPRTLSPEQIDTVIESVDTSEMFGVRDRAFLELLYSTGARRGEVLNMKIKDVNFIQRLITITGKGNKQRTVPVGETALKWLKNYLHVRPKGKNQNDLWLTSDGDKMQEHIADQLFKKIRKNTGINCSSHTLRRSCATHLLQNGMHPSFIAELLGHASSASLKHYLKVEIEELKETQSLLGGNELWKQL